MTRTSTLGLALVGLAALVPPAAANSCTCSDHHASYYQRSYYERAQRTAHYAHAPRYHRQTRYVVVERPRYETVYEVYGAEPEMVAPYEGDYWVSRPVEPYWSDGDRPYLYAGFGDGL